MTLPGKLRLSPPIVDPSCSAGIGSHGWLGSVLLPCIAVCPWSAWARPALEAEQGHSTPIDDAVTAEPQEIDVRNYALALNARGDTLLLEEHEHRARREGDVDVVRVRVVNRDGDQLADWRSPLQGRSEQIDVGRLSFGPNTPALLGDDRYVACSIGDSDGWAVWVPDHGTVAVLAGAELQLRAVFPYGTHDAESIALLGAFTRPEGRTIVLSWARIHGDGSKLVLEHMEVDLGNQPRETTLTKRIEISADDLLGTGMRLVRAIGAVGHDEGLVALRALASGQSDPERWALLRADLDAGTLSGVTARFDIKDVVALAVRGSEVALALGHGSIIVGELTQGRSELQLVSQLIVPNGVRSLHLEAHRLLAIPRSRDQLVLVIFR